MDLAVPWQRYELLGGYLLFEMWLDSYCSLQSHPLPCVAVLISCRGYGDRQFFLPFVCLLFIYYLCTKVKFMDTFAYYFSRLFVIAYFVFGLLVFISLINWMNWLFDKKKYEDKEDKEDKND